MESRSSNLSDTLNSIQAASKRLFRASGDPKRVIHETMRIALSLFPESSGQMLCPSSANQFEIVWSTVYGNRGMCLPLEGSLVGKAAQRKKIINIRDVNRQPAYRPLLEGVRSAILVPMIDENGVVIGVLELGSHKPRAFDGNAKTLLLIIATQATLAYKKAHAYKELVPTLELQSAILSESHQLDNLLALIARRAQQVAMAEVCQIFMVDGEHLVLAHGEGSPSTRVEIGIEDSVAGLAVLRRTTVNIPSVKKHPFYRQFVPHMKSELAVPLVVRREPVGVINLESPRENAFSADHIALLQVFAGHAAMAISLAQKIEQRVRAERVHADIWRLAKIGDAIANAAHRLNNAVGAIPLLVGEIRSRSSKENQENAFLSDALDQIEALSLQALEVPKALRTHVERASTYENVDLKQLISRVVLSLDIPRSVNVVENYATDTPEVCVPGSFDEVIRNLVVNGLEAMPRGGTLTIATTLRRNPYSFSGDDVEVLVSDTGVGITNDALPKIFSGGFSTKPHGLGFGLWSAKYVVEQLGGKIWVDQTGEGLGTTIKLIVPVKPVSRHHMAVGKERPLGAAATRPFRAIVIEDHRLWQGLIEKELEAMGFQVTLASSYREARRLVGHQFFHVAIVDLSLAPEDESNRDGMRILREIQELDWGTSCIVVSAYATAQDALQTLAYGAVNLIDKSSNFRQDLQQAVRLALERTEAHLSWRSVQDGLLAKP